jgi:membrane protein DedA with SNARE-associated domain
MGEGSFLAPWAVYLALFLGPFVQEDAAVVGAAVAAVSGQVNPLAALGFTFLGLLISDGWKYWVGRLAHSSRRASRWIADPRVQGARERVLRRLGMTLLIARFVPGTRIPLYVACGVFKAPFWRFITLVALSGALYLILMYAFVRSLGAVMGDQVRHYAPFVAIGIVATVLIVQWLRHRTAKRPGPSDQSPIDS